jgi:hypothetical protein
VSSSRSSPWARSRPWPTAAWRSTACVTGTWSARCSTSSAPAYANRNGGYLRILKFGFRQGDNAPMAYVELVDRAPEAAEPVAAE